MKKIFYKKHYHSVEFSIFEYMARIFSVHAVVDFNCACILIYQIGGKNLKNIVVCCVVKWCRKNR